MLTLRKDRIAAFFIFNFALLLNGLILYYFACEYLFGMVQTVKIFTGLYFVFFISVSSAGFLLLFGKRLKLAFIDLVFIGYACLVIASLMFGIFSGDGDYARQQLVFFIIYGMMGYIAGRLFPRDQLLKLARFILIIGAIEIAASFFVLAQGGNLERKEFYFNLSGNPLLMGATYLRIILAGSVYAIYLKIKNKAKPSVFSWIFILLITISSLFLLLLTSARQMIAGLFLCLIYASIYFRVFNLKRVKWLFACLLAILIVGGLFAQSFPSIFSRYQLLLGKLDYGSLLRVEYMKDAYNIFINNPLFGTGAATVTSYPHNIYLHAAAELGLPGLLITLALTLPVVVLIAVSRYHKNNPVFSLENLFLFSIFITVFFSSLVSGSLYDNFDYYLILGVVAGAFPDFFAIKIKKV